MSSVFFDSVVHVLIDTVYINTWSVVNELSGRSRIAQVIFRSLPLETLAPFCGLTISTVVDKHDVTSNDVINTKATVLFSMPAASGMKMKYTLYLYISTSDKFKHGLTFCFE